MDGSETGSEMDDCLDEDDGNDMDHLAGQQLPGM